MKKKLKDRSLNVGVGFGIASGVITTLGLMIGIYASTLSRGHVLGAIFTISIADAFSDAVGIHFSKETEGCPVKEIWHSTVITFISKFIVSISFIVAILLLPLKVGIITNIVWSYLIVCIFSYYIAKKRGDKPLHAIFEHFLIMTVVIICTYYVGKWIDVLFIN